MEEKTNDEISPELEQEISEKIYTLSVKLKMPWQSVLQALDSQGYDHMISCEIMQKMQANGMKLKGANDEDAIKKAKRLITIGALIAVLSTGFAVVRYFLSMSGRGHFRGWPWVAIVLGIILVIVGIVKKRNAEK